MHWVGDGFRRGKGIHHVQTDFDLQIRLAAQACHHDRGEVTGDTAVHVARVAVLLPQTLGDDVGLVDAPVSTQHRGLHRDSSVEAAALDVGPDLEGPLYCLGGRGAPLTVENPAGTGEMEPQCRLTFEQFRLGRQPAAQVQGALGEGGDVRIRGTVQRALNGRLVHINRAHGVDVGTGLPGVIGGGDDDFVRVGFEPRRSRTRRRRMQLGLVFR